MRGDVIAGSLHVAHVLLAVDVAGREDAIEITGADLTRRGRARRAHVTTLQGKEKRTFVY